MMSELLKQMGSTLGAAFAAACCLGVTAALSALTAIGAGFLINDAFLIPLYVLLLALSLWLLYRSAKAHRGLGPLLGRRRGGSGRACRAVDQSDPRLRRPFGDYRGQCGRLPAWTAPRGGNSMNIRL